MEGHYKVKQLQVALFMKLDFMRVESDVKGIAESDKPHYHLFGSEIILIRTESLFLTAFRAVSFVLELRS